MRKQAEFTPEDIKAKIDEVTEALKGTQESDEVSAPSQPSLSIRLEDGSIFALYYMAGVRILKSGRMNHVQVFLSIIPEWQTHMSTQDAEKANSRFTELSSYLCDIVIEPDNDPDPVSASLGPAVPQGMSTRPVQSQYGGFGENRQYPNPTSVVRPLKPSITDDPLYVKPDIPRTPISKGPANPYAVKNPIRPAIAPNPINPLSDTQLDQMQRQATAIDRSLLPSRNWASSVTLDPKPLGE